MVKLPALRKLKITELTKDNIGSVIDVLKDTPKEVFDTISKKDLLNIYYRVRVLMNEDTPDYFS